MSDQKKLSAREYLKQLEVLDMDFAAFRPLEIVDFTPLITLDTVDLILFQTFVKVDLMLFSILEIVAINEQVRDFA